MKNQENIGDNYISDILIKIIYFREKDTHIIVNRFWIGIVNRFLNFAKCC